MTPINVFFDNSYHPLSRDFKQTLRYHGYSMGNLDKTKVQERGIEKLNFVCELMSFIADELKYQMRQTVL